jgi:hypothetical protein
VKNAEFQQVAPVETLDCERLNEQVGGKTTDFQKKKDSISVFSYRGHEDIPAVFYSGTRILSYSAIRS